MGRIVGRIGIAFIAVLFALPAGPAAPRTAGADGGVAAASVARAPGNLAGFAQIEAAERARDVDRGELAALLDGGPGIAPATAIRAALALGRTRRPENAPPLRRALARPGPLRAMAVFGLGLIARPDDLDAVLPFVRRDPSSAVRYAACDAVGRIVAQQTGLATPALARVLVAAMTGDPDPLVRGHAAANLDVFGAMPGAPAVARAIEAAFDRESDATVRWHEMWTLYRGYATRADATFLARTLQSKDELVRIEALRAVGRRHDIGADHFVRPLIADSSWRVQLQARETLRALAGEPPTEHLTAFPPALNLPAIGPPPVAMLPPTGPSVRATPAPPAPSSLDLSRTLEPRDAAALSGPAAGPHPRASILTTRGEIVLRLYPEWAPVTVANFLGLAARGYFDGNPWFRIVPDFVHQTGDPNGNGDADAGYTIGAEESPIEQRSGVIAMGLNYEGKRALRDSAGTQFYITDSPQLHLDRDFSVFGAVESGFDVMANLLESDRIVTVRRIADD